MPGRHDEGALCVKCGLLRRAYIQKHRRQLGLSYHRACCCGEECWDGDQLCLHCNSETGRNPDCFEVTISGVSPCSDCFECTGITVPVVSEEFSNGTSVNGTYCLFDFHTEVDPFEDHICQWTGPASGSIDVTKCLHTECSYCGYPDTIDSWTALLTLDSQGYEFVVSSGINVAFRGTSLTGPTNDCHQNLVISNSIACGCTNPESIPDADIRVMSGGQASFSACDCCLAV